MYPFYYHIFNGMLLLWIDAQMPWKSSLLFWDSSVIWVKITLGRVFKLFICWEWRNQSFWCFWKSLLSKFHFLLRLHLSILFTTFYRIGLASCLKFSPMDLKWKVPWFCCRIIRIVDHWDISNFSFHIFLQLFGNGSLPTLQNGSPLQRDRRFSSINWWIFAKIRLCDGWCFFWSRLGCWEDWWFLSDWWVHNFHELLIYNTNTRNCHRWVNFFNSWGWCTACGFDFFLHTGDLAVPWWPFLRWWIRGGHQWSYDLPPYWCWTILN